MEVTALEYGFIGAILVALWKLLDVAKIMFLGKRRNGDDPFIGQRRVLDDVIENQKRLGALVGPKGEGPLSCVWKDRDEVNAFMNAIKELTVEVKLMCEEMQRQRPPG